MPNWTAKMHDHDLSVTSERLAEFRNFYVADGELSSRMSDLFWFDMYVLDLEFGVSPNAVLRSIENLEAGEPHSGIKAATLFKNPPLRGLWHKHFFSAHFLVKNMRLGLGQKGLEHLVEEVMDPKKSTIITQEMIAELARRVTHEPVEKRSEQGKITGEWIVFVKHDANFYLCLSTHEAGDQLIYDRVMEHCLRDFPELARWISEGDCASD